MPFEFPCLETCTLDKDLLVQIFCSASNDLCSDATSAETFSFQVVLFQCFSSPETFAFQVVVFQCLS